MWELDYIENWALKNWWFWTVVLEKTLESLLDCKEIQPVHPKEISPKYSLEGLMLKLKLQYSGHLMWRADSFEKTLMLGKIEGRRRRGWQRMRWLHSITNSMDTNLSKFWVLAMEHGSLVCYSPWGHKESVTTELNWTELMLLIFHTPLKSFQNMTGILIKLVNNIFYMLIFLKYHIMRCVLLPF